MWTEERDWICPFETMLARLVECSICGRNRWKSSDGARMDLEVIKVVAEGGYGRVYRCRDLDTGLVVVMKQISIVGISQGVPATIIREVSFLKELNHINIVSLLKLGTSDNKFVNLVFEHLDCDLHHYIQDRRYPKDAITRKRLMFQILSAVAYCHSRKVLHRDLKPRNLLIDRPRRLIKLADFGLAREFGDPDILYTKNIGTCWYRAPEILCNSSQYSTPADLWSVGCIFAEMVIRHPLFQTINCRDELEAIFRLLGTPTEDTWPGITKLTSNLHTYPKFVPLGLETFVTDLERVGLNLLSIMLCLNPSKRISAEAALKHAYFKDMNLVFKAKSAEQPLRCIPFP
ncbi:Cell division control protein [Spatholobus suberectus]|nr:Cell division control protein [Spatholobus suberectus]